MIRIDECILYRDFAEGKILSEMDLLMNCMEKDAMTRDQMRAVFFRCANGLVELAGAYGFYGNLWHDYLTYLLVNHENAYSKACEIRGAVEGSINEVAVHDFRIFKKLYDYDLTKIGEQLDSTQSAVLADYQNPDDGKGLFNKRIRDRICDLSVRLEKSHSAAAFKKEMEKFYHDYGVGNLGLHKAFRVGHDAEGKTVIEAITNIAHVRLDDLVGYEIPKQKLIDNTEAFVAGRQANNCLLFGDAGTGKSSSIKGILNEYYDRGLRIIEVYKHQFKDLNSIIAQVKNRNYKFIIFMDDLSFEETEIEYKYLKAVIEGGLEKKPDNVLIYATSNRRHLIKEDYSDKAGRRADDMHSGDTVQEKLSLAARFGVTIFFTSPDRKEFNNIVKTLADRYGVRRDRDELIEEANKWELAHGGLSGRTAQQFIDYLLGQEA
ncbi:MAG: ATP-binding protein [Lachnospiraceae bacterium]|jgi:predicted AAA+ superfamily ATPase|nr:ATP-binding protein [Lachnospiraceae bacterium]MCI1726569.1 ATP-binding protein [Lachnospiraceae bacterium]